MGNTEINSLFEIAINLENKGLYAQADKARNIMVRLSATDDIINSELIDGIIDDIIDILASHGGMLAAFGVANFIPFIRKELPLMSRVLKVWAWKSAYLDAVEIGKLASKATFNWDKFVSGEDTSAAEIADKILSLLSDICMIFNDKVPAFSYWAYIFAGLRVAFNVKRAKQLGHQMGGMPGGEVQMKQIEDFNINTAVSDPYANQVLKSIILELGINTDNANKHANASKLPKILGGLDFFMPYINKFDTQKKFKDLTSTNPSASTMEFKKGLLKITELIKAYQGLYRITGK